MLSFVVDMCCSVDSAGVVLGTSAPQVGPLEDPQIVRPCTVRFMFPGLEYRGAGTYIPRSIVTYNCALS
jgi:hypothetical protein